MGQRTEPSRGAPTLRIAFIGGRGVVGTYSGIETYYEELGSRLAERGHRVTAYCRSYFTPKIDRFRGIRIRRLPALRTKHLETISHSVLATLDALFRRYDVVQYHALGSAPLSVLPRLLGVKTVVSVRGLDWQRAKWGGFARATLRTGEWASARCPTATVVVSATLQRHYLAKHGRKPHLIPNAVVLGERRVAQRILQYRLKRDSFVLYAGRISPEKGIHTLLEALRPLPRHKRLVLAGGSSYSDTYIEQVRRAAWPEVLFLGNVGREEMWELLSNCYVFVLPSVMEGLSISLLEAVSYGNCIVTTSIPENLEVVGTAALTFPPGDVEALRAALTRLLDDPDSVAEYRQRALEHARSQPDWDEIADRTEALYLSLRSNWTKRWRERKRTL